MGYKRLLNGFFSLTVLLVLVQCSQPPQPPAAAAAAAKTEGMQSIRITGAGNSYPGFSKVGVMMLRHLKEVYPERAMWLDYHEARTQFRDGMLHLADGSANVVFANTPHLVDMAARGVGFFKKPIALRGIGRYRSDDWTVLGVDAKLGVRSFADIKAKKVALKISTGQTNGDNVHPFLLEELLKRHGIDMNEFRQWGGEIMGMDIGSEGSRGAYVSGKSNAVFNESGYDALWEKEIKARPMTFLSIDPAVAKQMKDEYGWESHTVRANYYPGQPEPFLALDFSDWVVAVREDLDEDAAYQIAKIFIERWDEVKPPSEVKPGMERVSGGYGGNPVEWDPKEAIKLPVPLHPGAIRYYREKGLLQ